MKKAFLLLCTLLLVLGCALPLAAYHLTRAVLGPAVSTVRLPLSSLSLIHISEPTRRS